MSKQDVQAMTPARSVLSGMFPVVETLMLVHKATLTLGEGTEKSLASRKGPTLSWGRADF